MARLTCDAATIFPWPRRKSFIDEIDLSNEIEDWCENYLTGPWTAANVGVYIYEKSDAVLYKMRWKE